MINVDMELLVRKIRRGLGLEPARQETEEQKEAELIQTLEHMTRRMAELAQAVTSPVNEAAEALEQLWHATKEAAERAMRKKKMPRPDRTTCWRKQNVIQTYLKEAKTCKRLARSIYA